MSFPVKSFPMNKHSKEAMTMTTLIDRRSLVFVLLSSIFIFCACAGPAPAPEPAPPEPKPFEPAVRSLTRTLLDRVDSDRGGAAGSILAAVEPFTDAESAEVPRVSRRIERIMKDEAQKRYPGIRLERLTTDTLKDAAYLISGVIRLAPVSPGGESSDRYYRIRAEVRNLKEIRVLGTDESWISDRNLNYAPTAIYRDNPFYFRGAAKKDMPIGGIGLRQADLTTRALLTEAASAYEDGDYKTALTLFQEAESRPQGRTLQTYAGLYMANRKLDRADAAERAFARIVELSVERYGRLTVKFLFDVNSADFPRDPAIRDQYDLWLRQIGRYFQGTDHCIQIVGHCSRSGSAEWNDKLSLMRAERIRNLLKASFPSVKSRSEAIGKGFRENIVGSGTDDERDAVDRRVEINLVECGALGGS